jgi:glycosyltransferase involved in cell wall biosynthesis
VHAVRIRASARNGAVGVIERSILVTEGDAFASDYDRWIAEYECCNDTLNRVRIEEFTRRPLVSIIMPVCDPDHDVLDCAIRSVRAQLYENWELCIADDGSKSSRVASVLDRHCREDSRIKLARLEVRSGISGASNAALAMACGEFAAMLDHDDELSPDALFRVVEVVNWRPEADVIYSDEDKIDTGGRRYEPFFKPDWSPDLLLSENYVCHLLVARLELVRAAGGFRSEYDGSQD